MIEVQNAYGESIFSSSSVKEVIDHLDNLVRRGGELDNYRVVAGGIATRANAWLSAARGLLKANKIQ